MNDTQHGVNERLVNLVVCAWIIYGRITWVEMFFYFTVFKLNGKKTELIPADYFADYPFKK